MTREVAGIMAQSIGQHRARYSKAPHELFESAARIGGHCRSGRRWPDVAAAKKDYSLVKQQ